VLLSRPRVSSNSSSNPGQDAERRSSSPRNAARPESGDFTAWRDEQSTDDPIRRSKSEGHREKDSLRRAPGNAERREAIAREFRQHGPDRPSDATRPMEQMDPRRCLAGGDAGVSHRRLRLGIHGASIMRAKGVIAREFDPTKVRTSSSRPASPSVHGAAASI